ncbi:MAG: LCP family protein [Bacilli bacterium]
MKKLKRKLKNSSKIARYTYYLLILVYLISFVFFTKSLIALKGIETAIRTILIIFFILWFLLYIILNLLNLITKKYKVLIITSIISVLFIILFSVGSYFINVVYKSIGNITENDKLVYTTNLVTLKDNSINKDSVIGMISKEDDLEGNVLAKKLMEKENLSNKIKSYDDYLAMLNDLYKKKIDGIFLSSNYITTFKGEVEFEKIAEETEVAYKYSEEIKNQDDLEVSDKDFSEPLTFLIMGVDSEVNGLNANAGFNGDTLMLVTFNPKNLDVTMVGIPRDTYVPIACNHNKYNKINSAAAYGSNCVINTVGQFLDVNIDYYVKINFKGVVDLVNAVGGVEVDVEVPNNIGSDPKKMCEQNSDRQFGSKTICITPGLQTLNGEEALAYARSRHSYIGGDLDRVRHQQQIVEAVGKKIVRFDSVSKFQDILSAISNNISTNMETPKILSGYKVMKNMFKNALGGSDFININKAYLETYSLPVYLPWTGGNTSAQGYYEDSLADIQDALKITLEKKAEPVIKTFSFSVNEEYVLASAGTGKRKIKSLILMPNLIGSSVGQAKEFCSKNNIKLTVENVDPKDEHYNGSVAVGLIGDQDVSIGVLVKNIKNLTVYVVNSKDKTPVEPEKKPSDEKEPDKKPSKPTDESETDKKPTKPGDKVIDDLLF